MIDVLSWILLMAGGLLGVTGTIGMLRFPDFYSRQHAAGVADVLCALLILAGLGLQAGLSLASVKLIMVFLFLFLSSPAASHAVANAAMLAGFKPVLDDGNNKDKS